MGFQRTTAFPVVSENGRRHNPLHWMPHLPLTTQLQQTYPYPPPISKSSEINSIFFVFFNVYPGLNLEACVCTTNFVTAASYRLSTSLNPRVSAPPLLVIGSISVRHRLRTKDIPVNTPCPAPRRHKPIDLALYGCCRFKTNALICMAVAFAAIPSQRDDGRQVTRTANLSIVC